MCDLMIALDTDNGRNVEFYHLEIILISVWYIFKKLWTPNRSLLYTLVLKQVTWVVCFHLKVFFQCVNWEYSQDVLMNTIFFVDMYMYKTNWKLTFLSGDVLSQYMWYNVNVLSAANASIFHSSPLHNIYSLSGLV